MVKLAYYYEASRLLCDVFFFPITREVLQIVPLILPSTVPSLFSVFFNMIKPLLNGTTLSKVSVFGKGEHFLSGPCML